MARTPLSTQASVPGFALLAALAADAMVHGTPLPPPPSVARSGRLVAFTCAQSSWLIGMEEVAGVARSPRVARVPGTQPWLRGLAAIDGRLTPVVDLAVYLGAAPAAMEGVVLALTRQPGAGLFVDQVLGLVAPDQVMTAAEPPDTNAGQQSLAPWITARVQVGSRVLNQFDLDRLLADPAFLDATKRST